MSMHVIAKLCSLANCMWQLVDMLSLGEGILQLEPFSSMHAQPGNHVQAHKGVQSQPN